MTYTNYRVAGCVDSKPTKNSPWNWAMDSFPVRTKRKGLKELKRKRIEAPSMAWRLECVKISRTIVKE